jgi:hypothetical protein
LVLASVSYTISGLTNLGTASAVSPGFRTATPASFSGHVRFDNFVDLLTTLIGHPPVARANSANEIGTVSDGTTPTGAPDNGAPARQRNLQVIRRIWSNRPLTTSALGRKKVVAVAGGLISLPAGKLFAVGPMAMAAGGDQGKQKLVVTYKDSVMSSPAGRRYRIDIRGGDMIPPNPDHLVLRTARMRPRGDMSLLTILLQKS